MNYRKLYKKLGRRRTTTIVAVSAFIVLGGFILVRSSFAATLVVAAEAEAGSLSGNASNITDANASGTKAIKFASGGTTPPTTPPTGTIKIMPFGDSITEGDGWIGGYRVKLFQLLTSKGYDFDFVGSLDSGSENGLTDTENEGHGGWCLDDVNCYSSTSLAAETSGWVTAANPDLVLVHGGTNDLNSSNSGAEIAASLQKTLDNIYSAKPGVRVIVAKIVKDKGADTSVQADYASRIDTIVSTMSAAGKLISSVDMTNTLAADTDYTDETHPNQSGYNKMADAWMTAITAVYGK